jgi:hypothetical protein
MKLMGFMKVIASHAAKHLAVVQVAPPFYEKFYFPPGFHYTDFGGPE